MIDNEFYMTMRPQRIQATLVRKTFLTPTVMLVRLGLAAAKLDFRPGQYVVLHLPVGSEIVERLFSIASPPADRQTPLELLVRLVAGGVASHFFTTAKIGSPVTLSGPKGRFTLPRIKKPIRMIASGTGIAPFRSMLLDLLAIKKATTPIHLTFIVPTEEEIFMRGELERLAETHENFSYQIVLDLARYLEELAVAPREEVYICGGINFVTDITKVLRAQGVGSPRVHSEKFV